MILTKENIQAEVKRLTDAFKARVEELTGVAPVVVLPSARNTLSPILLNELEDIMNKEFNSRHPELGVEYPEGIRNKSRRRPMVTYRQIFFHIGCKMNYATVYLADFLGYDHATVIYARDTIQGLLETQQEHIVSLYKTVIDEYTKRLKLKGTLQPDDDPGIDTESVLSSMLYAGVDKSGHGKYPSGTKGAEGEPDLDL